MAGKHMFQTAFLLILFFAFFLFIFSGIGSNAPFAAAVTTPPPPSSNAPFQSVGDVINWFNAVADVMQVVFWIAAVMSGIYAGFLYLTASAEPEKISKAKWQFIYTLIATAMAIMAFGIPKLVDSILTVGKK